jgi:hypothetical protein
MKLFVENILLGSVEKIVITCVQPTLVIFLSTICTFNLWMSKRAHDVCAIVNFILSDLGGGKTFHYWIV